MDRRHYPTHVEETGSVDHRAADAAYDAVMAIEIRAGVAGPSTLCPGPTEAALWQVPALPSAAAGTVVAWILVAARNDCNIHGRETIEVPVFDITPRPRRR